MASIVVTVSMPGELADALRDHARRADRSFSAELRVAIRKHLSDVAARPDVASSLERLDSSSAR